ncbi:MAG: LPS assembly lipoprotein LptE [Pseudomonadota bacterium]
MALLPLGACGFSPVYAPGGPGTVLRGRVAVEPPSNRLGFELVARLEERLGRTGAGAYQLDHTISTSSQGIAITDNNDITRIRLNGMIDYALTETGSGLQLLAGQVGSFTAYSTTGSTLATDAAERDAETRLMVLLADRIVDELLAGAARFS